jgi:hypothetical protein
MATSEFTTPETGNVQRPFTEETPPSNNFKERRLTVSRCALESRSVEKEQTGESRSATPTSAPFLRLRGLWLAAAGFPFGARLRIGVTPGRLVIETVPEVTTERLPHLSRRTQKLLC